MFLGAYLFVLNDSMCMLTPMAIAASSICNHSIPFAANIMLISIVAQSIVILYIFNFSGIDLFSRKSRIYCPKCLWFSSHW